MSIRILALAAATVLAAGSVSAGPTPSFGTGVNSGNYSGDYSGDFQIVSKDRPAFMMSTIGPSDPTPTFGTGVHAEKY